jgi:hypothetical protein
MPWRDDGATVTATCRSAAPFASLTVINRCYPGPGEIFR